MSSPNIETPGLSESAGIMKVRYADSPKRRRFQRFDLRAARGFKRGELKGRVPITRSPRR